MNVDYIQHYGSDLVVANAARVSMDKESSWFAEVEDGEGTVVDYMLRKEDSKLIAYLAKHQHYTPFEHCGVTLRLKVPLFVRSQIHRHRTFAFNEISRRYVKDNLEFYWPDYWRMAAPNVKQGSSDIEIKFIPPLNKEECLNCGTGIKQNVGGARTKYCSDKCKYTYINRNRDPYKVKFQNAKARAKREGVYWDLEFEDIEWPEYCPILKMKLVYENGREIIHDDSPSFDKIDPNKPYTKDNVWIISHLANTMKSSANNEQLLNFSKWAALHTEGIVIPDNASPKAAVDKMLKLYHHMVDDLNICVEQARMILPQNLYTTFYMTGNLRNWAHFLKLRLDSHAQKEVRDVAEECAKIIEPLFPVSYKALMTT